METSNPDNLADADRGKIFISKDVTFDEEADWSAPVELCSGDWDLRNDSMEAVEYFEENEYKMDDSLEGDFNGNEESN